MSAPEIITCQIHRKAFYVLGIENKKSELIHDPRCPACWDEFFQRKQMKLYVNIRLKAVC